jgi:membrane protein YdbS with pleckstrin-like domain
MLAVPVGKVQSVSMTRGWLDRIYGLASVAVVTATVGRTSAVQLPDLRYTDARELLHGLEADATAAGMWQLEAV